MNIRKFVKSLPYPLKQSLKYIYGLFPIKIRYGKVFWDTYNFLQKSQWWSREKLEQYQLEQLSKLLNHSYKNVPYYKNVFNEIGLKPKDIKTIDDLKKLPTLTKDKFRENYKFLTANNFKINDLITSHTSGTTGKPLQWYVNDLERQKELAFIFHQWSRMGVKPGEPLIQLRGSVISGKKLYEYDPVTKVLRLSPRIGSKEVTKYYIEKIQKFGAKFLHGYPSAIALFAYNTKEYKIKLPFKLKAILFASEKVYSWQREITEEVFGCRVYDFYGMSEKVALAGECEKSMKYHFVPQYGVVEIERETNEIIGTSFINYVTPFIRYKTTDVASMPVFSDCNKCGRNYYPVLNSIEGRLGDFIITSNGNFISSAAVTHLFRDLETIKNTQIVQETTSCIKLNIVPNKEYNNSPKFKYEVEKLCTNFKNLLNSNLEIKVNIVTKIKVSKSGKFKWIESLISDSFKKRLIR